MIIPKEVEEKIKLLCNKCPTVEWSGTLFFTYEGSFETNDLVITCKDIFLMDIGTSAYTEFDMNPDVINYMSDNIELLDCQMGLIHSHNQMATFFSGTDIKTLQEEGEDRNTFVSLIVNNAGTYTAAITRRIESINKVVSNFSYSLFGEETPNTGIKEFENTSKKIQYFMLDIEKENYGYDLSYFEQRYEEIKKKKTAVVTKTAISTTYYKPTGSITPPKTYTPQSNKPKTYNLNKPSVPVQERTLFDDYDFEDDYSLFTEVNNTTPNVEELLGKVRADKRIIEDLLAQIYTGSILVSSIGFEEEKWKNQMENLYNKRFGNNPEGEHNFTMWAEAFCEYLTWYVDDDTLYDLGLDSSTVSAIIAYDLIEELEAGTIKNKYVDGYIKALETYVIV